MRGFVQRLPIIAVVLVLAACGGGGGGGSSSATLGPVKKDEPVTPPVSNELSKSKDPPSVVTPRPRSTILLLQKLILQLPLTTRTMVLLQLTKW